MSNVARDRVAEELALRNLVARYADAVTRMDSSSLRDLFALPTESFRWNNKFNLLGFVVGDGSMIVSDGPDHRRRRSSVQSAFGLKRLNGWIPMIVAVADAAIDRVVADLDGNERVVDL